MRDPERVEQFRIPDQAPDVNSIVREALVASVI